MIALIVLVLAAIGAALVALVLDEWRFKRKLRRTTRTRAARKR